MTGEMKALGTTVDSCLTYEVFGLWPWVQENLGLAKAGPQRWGCSPLIAVALGYSGVWAPFKLCVACQPPLGAWGVDTEKKIVWSEEGWKDVTGGRHLVSEARGFGSSYNLYPSDHECCLPGMGTK